jgi:hypothetical protein
MAKRVLVVAFALVAVACTPSERDAALKSPATAPRATAPAGPERSTVLGLLWGGRRAVLARLDARTLRPVGRRIEVGGGGSQAFSPNRRTVVVASAVVSGPSADSGRSELSFVDVRTMRRMKQLELRASGLVSDILWSEPDRLVVLLDDPPRVVAIEMHPLRATSPKRLSGRVAAIDAKAGRLVLLLAPAHSIGPSQLAVVESDGRVRAVDLGEILSGWEPVELTEDPYATRQRIPGLAVSPNAARAVVIPAGDRVADVDLDSLRVSYHELSEPVSLFKRLSNWLEPEAEAKTVEGPDRFARWVGEHQVAVTGTSYLGPMDSDSGAYRAGLRLIDTRDWSVRTLAKQAAGMVVVRDLVLAYAWAYGEGVDGIGLRAYGPDGEERFHLFGNRPLDWVEAASPYAYVPRDGGERFEVVDLRSGRVVARPKPRLTVSIVEP